MNATNGRFDLIYIDGFFNEGNDFYTLLLQVDLKSLPYSSVLPLRKYFFVLNSVEIFLLMYLRGEKFPSNKVHSSPLKNDDLHLG